MYLFIYVCIFRIVAFPIDILITQPTSLPYFFFSEWSHKNPQCVYIREVLNWQQSYIKPDYDIRACVLICRQSYTHWKFLIALH